MAAAKNRQPIAKFSPERNPQATQVPESYDKQQPAWQFHRCDNQHSEWGWNKEDTDFWDIVVTHLAKFETMTWADIKAASGGKKSGTNSHSMSWENFSKGAKDQIEKLKLTEFQDSFFSLRIMNTLRLYGIKDGRVMRFVFHDPYHESGNSKAVYRWGS